MAGRRHSFGKRIIETFLVALLLTQAALVASNCVWATTGLGMAYASTEMPAACAGLSKNACLMAYLQGTQVPGAEGTAIGAPNHVAALLIPFALIAAAAAFAGPSRLAYTFPSTAPPAHVLLCRMRR